MREFYELLGLSENATDEEITNRFNELREKYREEYKKMTSALSEIERLSSDEREKERKTELLTYQINDIESAGLKLGEEEELDSEKKMLKNFRQIAKQVSTVYRALYKNDKGMSATRLVDIAHDTLEGMTEFIPEAAEYAERLYEISFEMEHIAENVLAALPRESSDPEKRLDEIETRLDIVHKLKRKYGSSVPEVLEYLDKSRKELDEILLSDDKIKELEKEVINCFEKNKGNYGRIRNGQRNQKLMSQQPDAGHFLRGN